MLMYRIVRLAKIGDRTGQLVISRRFGLNVGDWRVLGAIHALAPVTLAGLARELYIDKGQLSRTVSGLIETGLVSHRASTSDRRQNFFGTTARGRKLHGEVLAYITRRNVELLADLDAAEQAEFFRLLDKIGATFARSYDELFGTPARQDEEAGRPTSRSRIARKAGGAPKRAGERRNVGRASAGAAGS
ncbi:MAG TPA: MarR family transcriptional regulator [Rhodoblastus sp.]|nr:MarR family transcriptional regulator [Rhodoblastus sp.]